MRIIAAFPGTGRRAFVEQYPNIAFVNPPLYPWDTFRAGSERLLHRTLEYQRAQSRYSVVTPHLKTLAYLDRSQQEYLLVLPDAGLSEAYQARYLAADAPEGGAAFATYMAHTWDFWLFQIRRRAHARRIVTLEGDDTLLTRVAFHQSPDYLPGYPQIENTDPCSVG